MMTSYLQILEDSLTKKAALLSEIEKKSLEQTQILRSGEVSFQSIDENMDEKARLIGEVDALDRGFESLYEKIREELLANKESYREEIRRIQELITLVTEKSTSIQAIEARNKAETEIMFSRQKKNLQTKRNAMAVANDYYQSMNKIKNLSPQFLDRKK